MSMMCWGFLGTGNIARQFATGVKVSQRGRIAAVGSRSVDIARQFAETFGVPAVCGGYEHVLADPSVNAVYIALPNSMHREWTIRALRAGKHVLCEKPIAANAVEAEEMFDVARQTGRVLIEAFMYRSHPLTQAVLASIAEGAVGNVRMVRSSFCYRTRRTDGNIRFSAELAGGSLMDIGCYCIDLSRLIAGSDPVEVRAYGQVAASGVDESAVGMLRFGNGILASFTCGMIVQANNAAHVCGDEGYVEIPVPWKPPARQAEYVIAQSAPPRQDAAASQLPALPTFERRFVDAGTDLYAVEADDFAATIFEGKRPMMGREESIGNMRVLDEMRRQIGVIE